MLMMESELLMMMLVEPAAIDISVEEAVRPVEREEES